MADVKLFWKEWGGDCAIQGGDLAAEDGLTTAVVLSLFLDARAQDDDTLPDNSGDPRGWWADTVAPAVDGDRVGSRLWLLHREKQLPEVLRRARTYAAEALQWLVDDGVARAVDVQAFIPRNGWLGLAITITKRDGASVALTFNLPREAANAV